MFRWWLVGLILCAVPVFAQPPQAVTLFDFESGVGDWRANPWSGGQGFVEAAPEAKYGNGALRARYVNIPQSGNMISPYLPEDAAWRTGDYDRICLWVKGDGTQSFLSVVLASEIGDMSPTHSGQIPLDSTQWRRFCLKFDTLWNRQGKPFALKDLKRLYFGAGGTHDVLIDQVTLLRPLRRVPLPATDNPGPAAVSPELYADAEGKYFLHFDPKAVLEPTVKAEVTVQWPEQRAQTQLATIPALSATEETWLQLTGAPEAEGQGKLTMQLKEPAGQRCFAGRFTFPVSLPVFGAEADQLALVPRPKDLRYHPGYFNLPPELRAHEISNPDIAKVGRKYAEEELAKWFGVRVRYQPVKLYKLTPTILLLAPAWEDEPIVPEEVRERLGELKEQGYVLHVGDQGVALAALDEAGLRNGVITLMQALRSSVASSGLVRLPQMTIFDWPTLKTRAVNIGLPTMRWGYPNDAPVPVDFFIDFLRRTVVEQKINCVGLEVSQGMKLDKHPEIAGPSAYTKDEVRRIVTFLKDSGVEVFPIMNSLGHANWLVIPHPELREDGDENTLCTRNPATRPMLTEVYDEVLDVFQPRRIHFGLDEVRSKTLQVAPEKRCKLCAGLDKRDLFVEQVRWLDEYAGTRNVQMLMWADMVIREHNGGPPFNLADTVDRLPKDIVMCDWSATVAPLSLWDLDDRGFTVWKCNSRGVNNAQLPFVAGNMWGIWSRVPWLTESCWQALGYSYVNQTVAAEYSWNTYPDLMADGVPLDSKYFAKRPLQQRRMAELPAPGAGKAIVSLESGETTVTIAAMKLKPFAAPVAEEKSFAVEQPAVAAYALLAAQLPEDEKLQTAFYDEFKKKENWQGVALGELVLTLDDGQTLALPIRYGYHVRATKPEDEFPQAFGALGTATVAAGGTPQVGYLVQLPPLSPERRLKTIAFKPGTQAAKLLLMGLAVRGLPEAEQN
ncbi:MAG: family 20 glycosylhydrolase [Armatimonadia bacterium]